MLMEPLRSECCGKQGVRVVARDHCSELMGGVPSLLRVVRSLFASSAVPVRCLHDSVVSVCVWDSFLGVKECQKTTFTRRVVRSLDLLLGRGSRRESQVRTVTHI